MHRRHAILACAAGTASLAGCMSYFESDDSSPETGPENDSVPTNDTTDTSPESDNESDNESTQNDPPDQEDSLSDVEAVQPAIETLNTSLQRYVENAPGEEPTVLTVNSTSEEFDFIPVVNTARDVEGELESARLQSNEDRLIRAIDALRQERQIIDQMARTQDYGQQAVTAARDYLAAIQDNRGLRSGRNTLVNATEDFAEAIDAFATAIEEAPATIVRDRDRYINKEEQFRAEEANLTVYAQTFETVPDALDRLARAEDEYDDEDYDDAEAAATEAIDFFEAILMTLDNTNEETLTSLTDAFEAEIEQRRSRAEALQELAATA